MAYYMGIPPAERRAGVERPGGRAIGHFPQWGEVRGRGAYFENAPPMRALPNGRGPQAVRETCAIRTRQQCEDNTDPMNTNGPFRVVS